MKSTTCARVFMSGCLVLSLGSSVFARTWIVDRLGGGDFTDIQPAIDSATEGDLVLVRGYANNTYSSFTIDNKNVTVRSLGLPFVVAGFSPTVVVRNIPAGGKVAIGGMTMLAPDTGGGAPAILLEDSAGEILFESIVNGTNALFQVPSGRVQFDVINCDQVAVSDLTMASLQVSTVHPGVRLTNSTCRFSESSIVGQWAMNVVGGDGFPGGAGIEAIDSSLILGRSTVVGGIGGPPDVTPPGDGGLGGDGIVATRSEVIALGNSLDFIRGGDGGPGYFGTFGYQTDGGDGGVGFRGDSASVSILAVQGGLGGPGLTPGNPGADFLGTLTRSDTMPFINVTHNVNRGDTLPVALTTVEAGHAILILSNLSGFVSTPGIFGPPLSAVPGRIFLTFALGVLPPNGTAVANFPIPNNSIVDGLPLHFQGAVIGSSGQLYLTQAVTFIVGRS